MVRTLSIRTATAIACLLTALQAAADYRFKVPQLEMQVYIEPDASARIVYDITFENLGQAIDVVDIGVPHRNYRLRDVKASIDGVGLADIRPSEYVSPGFEVHLGGKTIGPGQRGTLHAEFTMPDMVWQDTTRADLASLQITPTWFGAEFVRGNTELKLAIHLPPGVAPDAVLHQGLPFTQKALFRERAVAVWQVNHRATGPYKVGLSFPKSAMQRVVWMSRWQLLLKWFSESSTARLWAGGIFLAGFAFLFFRFTGCTGIVVYVLASAAIGLLFIVSPLGHLLSFPVLMVLIGLNEFFLTRRRAGYMPPIAHVEGGGIKRGLTSPEAAALLNLPPPRILGMIVFGMLKKGLLQQRSAQPLAVAVAPTFQLPDDQTTAIKAAAYYREAAQVLGVPIQRYEQSILTLLHAKPDVPLERLQFGPLLREMFAGVAEKMKGFDVNETKRYYRSIVRRATDEAKAVGDINQRQTTIDRNFDWILLDDSWPTVFDSGPHPYRPIWTHDVPSSPSSSGGSTGGGSSTPSLPGQTTLGDVGASFAGWAENTFGSLATTISPEALQVPQAAGGFLDLSTADWATGEVFSALAKAAADSGRSGGGGGGGGCACAGCACACACAGGGR